MIECVVNGINVKADNTLSMQDIEFLVNGECERMKLERNQKLSSLEIVRVSDEEVELTAKPQSDIRRLRRITGYLSEVENFNAAKKAEEHDRYKHL
ncbi:MAG: anaerobic ribonucleoside-triphosphate reductase [Negativicutes bacterium]